MSDSVFDRALINPGIRATVLEDSLSTYYDRLTTFQLRLPTIILAELNTHRMFSRNASSARAIPFETMAASVIDDPFIPFIWTRNKPGMQGDIIRDEGEIEILRSEWHKAAMKAVATARLFVERANVHKQIANRLLTPFMWTNVVLSTTEMANFFELRDDDAAEPHMHILARKMRMAFDDSYPVGRPRHVPYVSLEEQEEFPPYVQFKLSTARCARVSYKLYDGTVDIEKDIALHDKLLEVRHMSPFEHQAVDSGEPSSRSGNFTGWEQYRKSIE